MSWGRSPPKRKGQVKISIKMRLILILGCLGGAAFFIWLAVNVAANCSAVTGRPCI